MNKKKIVATALDNIGLNKLMFRHLARKYKNNYVRVINYHEVYDEEAAGFEKHLMFYRDYFDDCDHDSFERFLKGEKTFKERPGIMLTFDDGYKGNYKNAWKLLNKYGFTGYFLISPGLVGTDGYMTWDELAEMNRDGHVIGCHTYSHHRMSVDDTEEILNLEIFKSRDEIREKLDIEPEIFCWCFGDPGSYTKIAYDAIKKAGYKYAFMTDSYPVLPENDPLHIQRTNIQTYWDLAVVRFQLSGMIDLWFSSKRKTDEAICS